MASKLPKSSLSLKQFLRRQEVLTLYRNILRTIRQVEDKQDKEYLKNWAKSDFKKNKNLTDEFAIKSLIVHGENSMKELKRNLNLTK
ncbi:LYR motif-containing protein 2 [Diachasma alloeum]|uniref:LYR motif-containing protein 2 n=1 Tax=Diachasma alloeum TaxID=454923 RepID=UPI0007382CD9|nr:LYR motif-containing protein 2 [Diachasma alloeum]